MKVPPESTTFAAPSIADYAERSRQTVTAWTGMHGQQGSDPARLAKALIELAGEAEPRCDGQPVPTPSEFSRPSPTVSARRPTPIVHCQPSLAFEDAAVNA